MSVGRAVMVSDFGTTRSPGGSGLSSRPT